MAVPALLRAQEPATPASTAPVQGVSISSPSAAISTVAAQTPLTVTIVYPREGAKIGLVSKSFVYGAASSSAAALTVNGTSVPVYRTGSYIATIPFSPGGFKITAQAFLNGATASITREITVAESAPLLSTRGPVTLLTDTIVPSTHAALVPGDRATLRFQGTPGLKAQWRLLDAPGLARFRDWQSMTERSSGSYEGVLLPRPGDRADKARVEFRLTSKSGKAVRAISPARLKVADRTPLYAAEISTTEATFRTGPALGGDTMGYDVFLPQGTRLRVTGQNGGEVRVQFRDGVVGWTDEKNLQPLPETVSARTILDGANVVNRGRSSLIAFNLRSRVPYRATISDDLMSMALTLYYTVSNVDRIRYSDETDRRLVEQVRWTQEDAETVELKILTRSKIWGYDLRYEGMQLVCELFSAPNISAQNPFSGLTVALDPGHSPKIGDGTMGPQGVTEGDAMAKLTRSIKARLEKAGAAVFVTRSDEEAVPLPERSRRAFAAKADLFLSLHANAIPDGANPFDRSGFSVFYFQPFSHALARAMHDSFKKKLSLRDDGFYYGNLAVCRATQMPAVLIETGYLILPEEEELLLDPAYHAKLAEIIVEGLVQTLRPLIP